MAARSNQSLRIRSNKMKRLHDTNEGTTWPRKTMAIALGLALFSASATATPGVGFTVQSTRSPIPFNVFATQGRQSPLFNLLMLSSNGTWGYDLIHTTITWAPCDGGRNSHSNRLAF